MGLKNIRQTGTTLLINASTVDFDIMQGPKKVFYICKTELKLLRTGITVKEAKLALKVRGILDPWQNPLTLQC